MVDGTKKTGHDAPADQTEHEHHELPKGALLMTLAYLAIITLLWMQVYLQLLNNGGVPRT